MASSPSSSRSWSSSCGRPRGPPSSPLRPLVPVFISYVLSFAVVGIYWNNHHHLFQAVRA